MGGPPIRVLPPCIVLVIAERQPNALLVGGDRQGQRTRAALTAAAVGRQFCTTCISTREVYEFVDGYRICITCRARSQQSSRQVRRLGWLQEG